MGDVVLGSNVREVSAYTGAIMGSSGRTSRRGFRGLGEASVGGPASTDAGHFPGSGCLWQHQWRQRQVDAV